MWSGEVEAASKYPIWEVIQWPSADQMRHLKRFILSEGQRYQDLQPALDLVTPNKSNGPKTNVGWAYCACTGQRDIYLLYFERGCPPATVSGLRPEARYQTLWFNPRTGRWCNADLVTANAQGVINLPEFPDKTCQEDWALKLTLADGQ